jgi:excisionase family DNA binding protein
MGRRDDSDREGKLIMPIRDETGQELLTIAEAARALSLSPATIRVLLHKRRLRRVHPSDLSPHVVLIPRMDIEAYKRDSLGKPPGPKKGKGGGGELER